MGLKTINFEAALEAVKNVDGDQAKQLRDACHDTLEALGEPHNKRARGKGTGLPGSININIRSVLAWLGSITKALDAETYKVEVERVQALHARLVARVGDKPAAPLSKPLGAGKPAASAE
jgi:hypothetical protein